MPWWDNINYTVGFGVGGEDRGIDDYLSDFLYANLTDRSWDHLYNTQRALYGQEGAPATHTLPGPDGPIEVYESNGKIFDADTGQEVVDQTQAGGSLNPDGAAIWELPVWGPRQSGSTASSGGGVQGAIDAITGAITGATGGAQNPNTIWDPINRQYGQGVLKKILGGVAFNELVNTSGLGYESGPAVNPTPSPTQSTYGGAPGPVREVPVVFPTPESPVQGQSHSTAGAPGPRLSIPAPQSPVSSPGTSTDAGGGGPRYYTGTAQSPVNSPETSTDAGGGGPRRGDVDGGGGGGTYPNIPDLNIFDMEDYTRRNQGDVNSIYYNAAESVDPTDPHFQQNNLRRALQGIFGLEGDLNPQQIGQQSQDFAGILQGFGQGYTDFASSIGSADIDLDEQKRQSMLGFFGGGAEGEYGQLLGNMREADPGTYGQLDALNQNASMLGGAAGDVIRDAGVLNARQRANAEDTVRGRYAATGRGGDTAALADEISNVTEAETMDRNRDLQTGASLMGSQAQALGASSGIQNQFVRDFLGAGQSIQPGLYGAESMKGTASQIGLDPGQIFNLAGLESQNRAGLEMAREEADAIREAGYYSAAAPIVEGVTGSISDWLTNFLGNRNNV